MYTFVYVLSREEIRFLDKRGIRESYFYICYIRLSWTLLIHYYLALFITSLRFREAQALKCWCDEWQSLSGQVKNQQLPEL